MIKNNHVEKTNFRLLIENDSVGRMEERLNIIDTFLNTEEHVTLENMMQLLKEAGYDYEPDFVRQCLNRFGEHGFAQKKTFDGQSPRYEHRHLGKHHDHFICTKCDKIIEFDNDEMERLQSKIASDLGFHMLQHKMEIYGLCSDCMAQRRPLMPLSMAKSGEIVVMRDMTGGRNVRTRLASMGLRSGDSLEIIDNNGQGRLIVGHGSTRLALGRGVAQKIMVSLAKPD